MAVNIHPTAFVDKNVELGENVTVAQCAVIEGNVIIGDGCKIGPFASVQSFTRMGSNNEIFSYALVGGKPQDLKYHGEESWLEIGDNNAIREFATLHRGTEVGNGVTKIGSNNLIMSYCHVAHDCVVGDNVIMSNNATLGGHVIVEDSAIIGGLSAIHQFVRIGEHAFVGGMTGVAQDLPPFLLAAGARAVISGPNAVGLRRMGAKSSTVSALRQAFRMLWLSNIPRQEALLQVEAEFAEMDEVQKLVAFMRSSQRGCLPASRSAQEIEN